MSTAQQPRTQPTAGPALVRQGGTPLHHGTVSTILWLPAAVMSVLFHGSLILALLFLLPGPARPAVTPTEDVPNETVVQTSEEEDAASKDALTNDEIDNSGTEPQLKINYNNDRKDTVSVPGVVNPEEPTGILNGDMKAPPTNLPPPPGLGGGQGGGLDGLLTGGNPVGMAGGSNLRGVALAGTFYGRSGATREKALIEGGGTRETEAAVALGLKWLIRQQAPDGRWPLDSGRFKDTGQSNDVAGTAFGLLPLLGAGYTHKKAKNSAENPFEKPIEKGLAYLIKRQDKKTGNFGGGMYAHSLATIAICEAYGLSQDPYLRVPAQKAIRYLVEAQHEAGGWRYTPGQPGDLSVSGWVVMALKSAQMANLDVPEVSMRKAINFLDRCCDKDNSEGYGYIGPAPSPTMSAVGLLCRQYLQNWGSQNLRMIKGIEKNLEPTPPGAAKNMYYYYYATQVLHHFGGDSWKRWNDKMRKTLVDSQVKQQRPGSDVLGSWDSAGDAHAAAGGRLMTTSLSLLTLEVYYRHLPLYYRDAGGERRLAAD